MTTRTIKTNFKARDAENGEMILEGYFARFDEPYEVFPGWIETIAPGAFSEYLSDEAAEVKAIWNHNSDIVLGSRKNGTASFAEDEKGLKGIIRINPKDAEAVNGYERVNRGDVDGCSFGFDIKEMEETWQDDGTYRTRILKVNPLWEVSPCTFPAYESTSIEARSKFEDAKKRKFESWKTEMMKKLKGEE